MPKEGEECLGYHTMPCADGLNCDGKTRDLRKGINVNSCAKGKCVCQKAPKEPKDVSGCLSYYSTSGCSLSDGASGHCAVDTRSYRVACCPAAVPSMPPLGYPSYSTAQCDTSAVQLYCSSGSVGKACLIAGVPGGGMCTRFNKCVIGDSTAKPKDVSGCLVNSWQATGMCVLSSGASGQCNINLKSYKVSCCNANNNQECETSAMNNLCSGWGGGKEGEPCGLGVDGTAKKVERGVCNTKGKCVRPVSTAGMGDTVFKCMSATSQPMCAAAGTDCAYLNMGGQGQCMDAKSANIAKAAMTCSTLSKADCPTNSACGYTEVGMPGMASGIGVCLDADNAKMMNDAMGDMLGKMGGHSGTAGTTGTTGITGTSPTTVSTTAAAACKNNDDCGAAQCCYEVMKKYKFLSVQDGCHPTRSKGGCHCVPADGAVCPKHAAPQKPTFGCVGLYDKYDCVKDSTCSWFTAPTVNSHAIDQTLAGLTSHCVDKKMMQTMTCSTRRTEGTCGIGDSCKWADIGAVMALSFKACVSVEEARRIKESASNFNKGSKDLKDLGGSVTAAATTLINKLDANDFTQFDKLGGADMKAVIGNVAAKIKKGEGRITKDAVSKIMDKVSGADGWGEVKDWGADKFEEANSLLGGLDLASLAAITTATFDAAMDNFGKVVTWAKDQAQELASKFKRSIGNMADVTAAGLNKVHARRGTVQCSMMCAGLVSMAVVEGDALSAVFLVESVQCVCVCVSCEIVLAHVRSGRRRQSTSSSLLFERC